LITNIVGACIVIIALDEVGGIEYAVAILADFGSARISVVANYWLSLARSSIIVWSLGIASIISSVWRVGVANERIARSELLVVGVESLQRAVDISSRISQSVTALSAIADVGVNTWISLGDGGVASISRADGVIGAILGLVSALNVVGIGGVIGISAHVISAWITIVAANRSTRASVGWIAGIVIADISVRVTVLGRISASVTVLSVDADFVSALVEVFARGRAEAISRASAQSQASWTAERSGNFLAGCSNDGVQDS